MTSTFISHNFMSARVCVSHKLIFMRLSSPVRFQFSFLRVTARKKDVAGKWDRFYQNLNDLTGKGNESK